ncbi:hypothetical protein CPAR01_02173 [Colletotrichum paranaense]|uniref:Zn(2)-C6 fungal-type domain-containing protein n=2 Tax=Colletotrichum acutatum species complex TaxID=2707335 RepID=A0AAI9XTR9_9PEZI|nr:uncharacterized protein CPAR01_02173 [Colletotrichum paranaense]KAK1459879.1 hypothetical protein CMEL01_02878 [Colletotrichum melonis]KAK1544671.1 hypothetical protein CPAR01_02173 [Colletotrichum paranaense]
MGRPPTSGYCHTCRRRRVKCDKARPACERCLKSGHKCLGYELPLRMQNFAATGDAGGSQQLVRVSNTSSSTVIHQNIVPELPFTAFRNRMAFSHLVAHYRWAPFWKPLFRMSLDGELDSDVARADYTGSLATALGFMGNSVNEPSMVAEGYELNGKVIRALHHAVSAKSNQELARWAFTIIILSLYQYAVENVPNVPHYYGMSKIIEMCGPECFQQEPMLTYLRQIRALHTSHDLLMDHFVDIPGLTLSIASRNRPLFNNEIEAARDKIDQLLRDLRDWRWRWKCDNPDAAREADMPLDGEIEDISLTWAKTLASRPIEVKTPEQAAELIIYNASITQLMNLQVLLDTGTRDPMPFPENIDKAVLKPAEDPLYTPNEVKYRWQPSMEGLRLMRLAPKLLSVSNGTSVMLAASPIGIIYNSLLATEGLGNLFLSTMAVPSDYAITNRELSVFRLW